MTNDYSKALDDYQHGLPTNEILKKHGLVRQSFYNALRRAGLPKRRAFERRPSPVEWDTTFFELIDTDEKAYWLGFLFADGCVQGHFSGDSVLNKVKIDLNARDINHLYALCRSIGATPERVKTYPSRSSYGECLMSRLVLTSRKAAADLVHYGCTPAKSRTATFPDLPLSLQPAFILGYLDGNGSITKDSTVRQWAVKFCGASGVLKGIQTALRTLTGRPFKQIIYATRGAFQFDIGGHNQVEEVLELLYRSDSPRLARKEEKYRLFLEQQASDGRQDNTMIRVIDLPASQAA